MPQGCSSRHWSFRFSWNQHHWSSWFFSFRFGTWTNNFFIGKTSFWSVQDWVRWVFNDWCPWWVVFTIWTWFFTNFGESTVNQSIPFRKCNLAFWTTWSCWPFQCQWWNRWLGSRFRVSFKGCRGRSWCGVWPEWIKRYDFEGCVFGKIEVTAGTVNLSFEMVFVVLGWSFEQARGFGTFASHRNYIKEE